jgi:hypothetical protein
MEYMTYMGTINRESVIQYVRSRGFECGLYQADGTPATMRTDPETVVLAVTTAPEGERQEVKQGERVTIDGERLYVQEPVRAEDLFPRVVVPNQAATRPMPEEG